ncbi:MAG: formate dehydrogenase accessory sulfurtransferase FdhD [Archaeoglobaceae archaeon]
MIRLIGEPLEVAEEKEIMLVINGRAHYLMCTPRMLKELALGFAISEGIAKSVENLKLEILDDIIVLDTNSIPETKYHTSGCIGVRNRFEGKIESKIKFRVDELRNYLSLLEVDEYKKTRGYHIAIVVEKGRFFRAYDVGRHNAVDKAIGLALLNKANLSESFLLVSGRISLGIATKCANAGIPLIVSKAAIFDSAIEFCKQTGLSAVSFATNIAIGDAIE